MTRAIINFIIWMMIILIGIDLNRFFLMKDSFSHWDYSYLFFSLVVSFLLFFSFRYYIGFLLILFLLQLVVCISELFSVDFSQEGLEVIEYSCNLMFPHNEAMFQFIVEKMVVNFSVKWSVFWSCIVIIINSNFLIYIMFKISSNLSNYIFSKFSLKL